MTRLFDLPVGKSHAFLLALQNQGFTLEQAEEVIADPSKAKSLVDALRVAQQPADQVVDEVQPVAQPLGLAQFTPLLHSLDEQLELLKSFDAQMPKSWRIPEAWYIDLSTASSHVQSVDDLEVLFVVRGPLERTWRYNWKLIGLAQGRDYLQPFEVDKSHLHLDVNAVAYRPGIHRIRINLIDGWSQGGPRLYRSVAKVGEDTAVDNRKLAGIEAIGAYALQNPKLLQMQDGKTLPYCYLTGLRQGLESGNVPTLRHYSGYGYTARVEWASKKEALVTRFATPTVLEY